MTHQAKLVQLRRKTDRDLLILVLREWDRGMTLADAATTKASPLYAQAETAYATVASLLPRIVGLSEGEQRDLEGKLSELQAALDNLPSRPVQHSTAGTIR